VGGTDDGRLDRPSRRRRAPARPAAERPATIADVAVRAGVSTATVSRILAGHERARAETRERVLEAARALDYRPSGIARSLQSRATGMLGLLMTDISQPFYTELIRVVESAAQASGYAIILANGAGDALRETAYLELLAERRVDGILVASSGITGRHLDWLVRAPVQVVLLGCEAPGMALPAVLAESRTGARLVADHLLALGHRRFGEILGPPGSAASAHRHVGVLEALAAAGIPGSELAVATSDGDARTGEIVAAGLLARTPRPTALVCFNDLTAIGALRAARDAGLEVPRDVSVVGFDDIPIASLVHPALTTVAQPFEEMGQWAVGRLASQIAAGREGGPKPPPEVVRVPCRLVVRTSTGPPPMG